MHPFPAMVAALAALILSAVAVGAQSTPGPTDPQQVVDAFELARGAGDLDAALAQLSDSAVITVQGDSTRSYMGADQIRSYLQKTGLQFQTVMRSRPLVQGISVSWTERDQYGAQPVDATVVATVIGGRIVSLTYRNTSPGVLPGLSDAAAARQPVQLPSAAWAAALAVAAAGLLAGAFARPRREASASQLNGRLLVDLRRDHEQDSQREKKAA